LSIIDTLTPSECAVELRLIANKLRRQTGLDIAPILVVEGPSDEALLGPMCVHGNGQVFAAGSRALVEQLAALFTDAPPDDHICVFLVDCDGRGKTVSLAHLKELLVTETCDIEADLVSLGVAERLAGRFLPSVEVKDVVQNACQLGLDVSAIRRAAHSVHVSTKKNRKQLRVMEFPESIVDSWFAEHPTRDSILNLFAMELQWSEADAQRVGAALPKVGAGFESVCLGKDALDLLFHQLRGRGTGEVRGWDCEFFHRAVFRALDVQDLNDWAIAQRLRAWETESSHVILRS
jgi:hypothetical protein